MTRPVDTGILDDHAVYVAAGRPLPLEVSRSRYDDDVLSWEVLYTDSPWNGNSGCSSPIAEFATWREAQDWAVLEARLSTSTADSRRILGPMPLDVTRRDEAWAAYNAGAGPHPHTLEDAWRLDDAARFTDALR